MTSSQVKHTVKFLYLFIIISNGTVFFSENWNSHKWEMLFAVINLCIVNFAMMLCVN